MFKQSAVKIVIKAAAAVMAIMYKLKSKSIEMSIECICVSLFPFPLFEKGCFHQLECLTRVIYIHWYQEPKHVMAAFFGDPSSVEFLLSK